MQHKFMNGIGRMVKQLAGVGRLKQESINSVTCSLMLRSCDLSPILPREKFLPLPPHFFGLIIFLGLSFASPCWAIVDPAAVTILKDQTIDFMSTTVANSLASRAGKISQAYSTSVMSIFGQANAIKDAQQRVRIQSWASKQSRYWANLADLQFKKQAKVTMATKLALQNGVAPLLEQLWVTQELESQINELKAQELQFNQVLPASAWDGFLSNVALATIDASLTATAQAGAAYVLSKTLSISLKAAGYPITIVWGVFGNPLVAGGPAFETYMPASTDATALVDWATAMSEDAAALESYCAGDGGCIEQQSLNTLTLNPFAPWPGYWSFFKLKYEYYNALGSPISTRYSWVTKYGICTDSNLGICPVTPGIAVIKDNSYPFRDVTPDNWASCYIKKIWSKGIASGNNGLYEPFKNITRAEFLKMVLNSAFSPSNFISTAPVTYFKDTDFAAWQNAYVNYALQRNIVHGKLCTGSNTDYCFYPNASITRYEAVIILVNAFGLQQNGLAINFPDASASQYPQVSVAASNKGNSGCSGADESIISGFKDGKFYPNTPITRDQAAKIIAIASSRVITP